MSAHRPLKLAFVGGGPNSAVGYAHFVACRMDNLWSLDAGVFSRNPDANSHAAQLYGVSATRAHRDVDELLRKEKDRLDAIVLLTPTPEHPAMVKQCLDAGIPVICEKALVPTVSEGVKLRDFCDAQGGFLAVVYNYSGYPMVRELRHLIRNGTLGDVVYVQAEMPQEGFLRTDIDGNKLVPQSWRLTDGEIPTIHLDLGVHLHELVYYLTGLTPRSVIADQANYGWFDVIDNVSCLCRYDGRVKGQFWFSKAALGQRNGLRLKVFGTKAAIEWCQVTPEEAVLRFADGRCEILDRGGHSKVASQQRYSRFKPGHPAGFNEALANLYVDLHAAVRRYQLAGQFRSDEVFGIDLALEGIRWLDAMVRSCESGQWESVG